MPSSPPPPITLTPGSEGSLLDQVAARRQLDPGQVQAALDGFDALLARRAARRHAATRELIVELYVQDDEEIAPARLDAEAEAACAQERDDRLAAELRRLVTPAPAVTRQARTLDHEDLDAWCQAAVDLLADAPRSLAEFGPEAKERHALDLANLVEVGKQRAHTAWQLQVVPGWRWLRRWRLRRELADLGRACQTAEQQRQAGTVRLAAIETRQAERAAWLEQPEVRHVLAQGAAAVRELIDHAQDQGDAATAELPVVTGLRPAAGHGGGS
jgi:hypothetical protein